MYYLITAIFDIKKWYPGLNRWRSAFKYIEMFNYFYDLDIPTILFIEEHLRDKIKPSKNLHIITKNLNELPAYQLLLGKDLNPISNAPHLNIHFTGVINSKAYLLNEAKKYLLNNLCQFTHLVWLDAGIGHIGTIKPIEFKENIKIHLHDKIMNVLMTSVYADEVKDLDTYLQYTRGKIAAGIIVIPINMIEWYHQELWTHYVYSVEKLGLLCFEEQIMSIPVGRYPEKFDFSYSDYIGIMKNLRYITCDLFCVLRNLGFCREHSLLDIGMKIIKLILESLSRAQLFISDTDCCIFLYNAQIISFYKDKELCKMLGLMLGYMCHNNIDGKKWVTDKLGNVKQNLSCIGLNLDSQELFNEEKIFEIDKYDFMWKIY